jgi:hypothetical protein
MSDLAFYLNLILFAGLLPTHLALDTSRSKLGKIVLAIMVMVWLLYLLSLSFVSGVHVRDLMLGLAYYGVSLFILLSELLIVGGAAWLTRKRGEQWTKEIDYVYLLLAALGLILSLGKFENASDRFELWPTIGPFLVASAIVLRAIKTRAEIGAWNKSSK